VQAEAFDGQHLATTGRRQIFDEGARLVPLYGAMDKLRNRYGDFSILRASGFMGSGERRNRLPAKTDE
jgi:hypothetical protein